MNARGKRRGVLRAEAELWIIVNVSVIVFIWKKAILKSTVVFITESWILLFKWIYNIWIPSQ